MQTVTSKLIQLVTSCKDVSFERITSKSRSREVCEARQVLSYVLRHNTKLTTRSIANMLGYVSHASVLRDQELVLFFLEHEDDYRQRNGAIIESASKIKPREPVKFVYIAHAVAGDVTGNMRQIMEIARHIYMTEEGVAPVVPYCADLMILDDEDEEQRAWGLAGCRRVLSSGYIDELWTYGKITKGMMFEIETAMVHGIPVVKKT